MITNLTRFFSAPFYFRCVSFIFFIFLISAVIIFLTLRDPLSTKKRTIEELIHEKKVYQREMPTIYRQPSFIQLQNEIQKKRELLTIPKEFQVAARRQGSEPMRIDELCNSASECSQHSCSLKDEGYIYRNEKLPEDKKEKNDLKRFLQKEMTIIDDVKKHTPEFFLNTLLKKKEVTLEKWKQDNTKVDFIVQVPFFKLKEIFIYISDYFPPMKISHFSIKSQESAELQAYFLLEARDEKDGN